MNLKNLFKTLFVLLFFVGIASAQTFYVNNASGNDANSGTAANQAKATVSAALLSAPSGSTISVAATGINYSEATPGMNLLPGPLTPGVTGTYTFTSTGGTPVFDNAFQLGTAAAAGTITFNAPFQFDGGLTLTRGTLAGGNNITVKTQVSRTNLGSITSGQLLYSGAVDFTYENLTGAAGTIITTGLEFPTSTTNADDLTLLATNANFVFKLDQNRTINGKLNADGEAGANLAAIDLNTFTLYFKNTATKNHVAGGNITNGDLNFTLGANETFAGGTGNPFNLPNITATISASTAYTLTLNATVGNVLNLTANSKATITANNVGSTQAILLNGSGNITTAGSGSSTTVTAASGSTGNITLNRAVAGLYTVTGITMSGTGTINFGAAATSATVNGNVLLDGAVTPYTNGVGAVVVTATKRILFNAAVTGAVIVTGNVTNSASFSGTSDLADNDDNAIIDFNNGGNLTINGTVLNNVSGSVAFTAAADDGANGGLILFRSGGTASLKAVTNSSTITAPTSTAWAAAGAADGFRGPYGSIISTTAYAGGFTATDVVNSSSVSTATAFNNDIHLGSVTGNTTLSKVSSEGTTTGGDIHFGNAAVVAVSGDITSTRGATGADINFGSAGVADSKLSAVNITNSGKSAINVNITLTWVAAAPANVVVTNTLTQSGTGSINFANATTGRFNIKNLTVSGGTLDFSNAAATGAIVSNGVVSLTTGTIDFGTGARTFTYSGSNFKLGDVGKKVTFNNSGLTNLTFSEPVPNVNQTITLGTLDQNFPGQLTVSNNAVIPAPYVIFQSADGTNAPGNLYVLNSGAAANGVTFTTTGVVPNTVELNNARIYVGRNTVAAGGNFQNVAGYVTTNGGYVMMAGNAAQTVNADLLLPTVAGATFGNFGVDNTAAAPAVSFTATVGSVNKATFTGDFYLAQGAVNPVNATAFEFAGTAPNWPTVYRTEGNFTVAPTVVASTMINITYYGNDKTTSLEVPAAGLLNNMTVATTNGAAAGKGIVKLGAATQVNGTLTVNAAQTLFLNNFNLTLAGASAIVNGYVVNQQGGALERIHLAAATGTAITGTGFICDIFVLDGSVGNTVANTFKGLFRHGFGVAAASTWGTEDFTTADGTIAYETGGLTTPSSLTAGFAALTAPQTDHFDNLNIVDANDTFALSSNAVMSGNITNQNGTLTLGDYTLQVKGNATFDAASATTSTALGKLEFVTAGTNVNVSTGAAVIGANVDFNTPGGGVNIPLAFDLTINGNVRLYDNAVPVGTTVTIGAGRTLTLGGASVTVDANSAFAGAGTLTLDVAAPNTLLTYTTPSSTVTNLTVADNVALTGAGTLAVTNFNHTAGDFNIGTTNLVIGTVPPAAPIVATYTRTGGTYSGNGYLVWNAAGVGTAWNHGPALSINNLEVAQALNITASATGLTVNDNLYLNNATLTHTAAAVNYLTVGDAAGATIRVDAGGNILVAAPAFVGPTDYLFRGNSSVPNVFTWPTAQADDVTLNTNAGQTVTVGASKSIAGNLTLTEGTLQWDTPQDITLASGAIVTRDAGGALDNNYLGGLTTGTLTAPLVNLVYTNAVGNTGIEYSLPTVVNNFTLGLPAGSSVTINSARTVAGTLGMNSTLTINANTAWTLAQTIPALSTVIVNAGVSSTWNGGLTVSGTYTNDGTTVIPAGQTLAGAGVINSTSGTGVFTLNGNSTLDDVTLTGATAFNAAGDLNFTGTLTGFAANANVTFGGAVAQNFTIPANTTFNNITLAKTANTKVMASGGNFTVATTLTLTRGVLELAPANTITLTPAFNLAGTIIGLGYVRNPAAVTNLAHIIGRVGVALPAGTTGRAEWPVGSANYYRPAAITFTAGNATIAPTTIFVNHIDMAPTGTKNFPVNGGVKFTDATKTLWINGVAPYYWSFEATTSLGAAQKFDVELNGTNLNRPLENHNDLRIVRRFDGDVTVNGWFLEGAANSYSNGLYVNTPAVGDTLLIVRNIGSIGSAISQKAFFTLGLPSQKPVFTATAPAAVTVAENATYAFTFAANDLDVSSSALVYSLQGTVPANATINATTGAFEFKPDYTQGSATPYNVTVRAAKANDATSYADYTFAITVTNVNRLPVFTTAGQVATASGKYGAAYSFTYAATDADAEAITFTAAIAPVPTGTFSISNAFGSAGLFTWTPTLADKLAGPFVITITATDASAGATVTTTNFTVLAGYERGDANTNSVVDVNDAIKILEHVVGKGTPLTAEQMLYADANTATGDGMVGALDASYVLKYIAAGNTWVGVSKVVATAGSVEFSRMSSENGVLSLPFAISGTKGVTSIYAEADLNNANIEVGKINLRLPEGWLSATTTENGKVRIAAAGTTAINDGIFATVEVTLKDKEAAVSILGNAKLNDELSSSLTAKVREIPTEFALSQNYPNPFNPTTSIKFSVAQDAKVNLVVYDMLGQRVRTLVDGVQEAGFYTVRWDGSNDFGSKVASGIYIYRLQAGSFVSTMKMNLMK